MKTIINPQDLEWFSTPLPSASLVHPDSRIITWNVVMGEYVETAVLAPYTSIPEYWIDRRGNVYAPSKFKLANMKWAWFKKF